MKFAVSRTYLRRSHTLLTNIIVVMALVLAGHVSAQTLPDLGNAQAASGTTSTTSTFHGVATADGGSNFGTAFQQTDNIVIQAEIVPEASHQGSSGKIYAVAVIDGVIYALFESTGWGVWDGTVPGLGPVESVSSFSAVNRIDVSGIADLVSGNGNIPVVVFLAYDTSANPGELYYSGNPLQFTVTAVVDYNAIALELFESNLATPVIQSRCIACHVEGGIGRSTGLVFQRETTASTLNNFNVFDSFLDTRDDALAYILSKASGTNHTGGIQLPKGGADYNNLQEFLATLTDSAGSNSSPSNSGDFFSAVTLQSNVATLRRAAIMLAGRLPTDAEIAQVTSGKDAVLRTAIRSLMQGEAFHQFLLDGANDRLLVRGQTDGVVLDGCYGCFPLFINEWTDIRVRLSEEGLQDNAETEKLIAGTYLGIIDSPLELIAYVVENERPYSEILTADYMMLNPTANFSVGGTAIFDDPDDELEFQPGEMTGYYRPDESQIIEELPEINAIRILDPGKLSTDYPHAGVLNTQAFLFRYPTTATNRNRARARWTFKHFLDVDIEKSAQRTTDPVALADKHNPTMNNSNCTVCHATMDPVAGAFQNYSDEGYYRSEWGGLDSLDNYYKYPEDGSTSIYQDGDSWYRDMRKPGIFDSTAQDPENSLQWLAQQIVKEPGFATAAVKFWWPSIIGDQVLNLPEVEEDATYQAQLAAYDAQNSTIQDLVTVFNQSDMNLKDTLVEMMMSPWFRIGAVEDSELSPTLQAAQDLANVGNEKLLTPERLQRKTAAITGFNWKSNFDTLLGKTHTGLGSTYRLYYGGIDSFGVTKRSTELTPLMSTVAMSHALESACPIVLREFILPDGSRKLFNNSNASTTPLTESVEQFQLDTAVNPEKSENQITVHLSPGEKHILFSTNSHFCDWDEDAQMCKTEIYLNLNKLEVEIAGSNQRTTLRYSDNNCGWDNGGTEIHLYGQCSATFPFTVTTDTEYTFTFTSAPTRLGAPHPKAEYITGALGIETTDSAINSNASGAILIKEKLVELHEKMLGKTLTINSPDISAAYQLFVRSWEERVSSGAAPHLLWDNSSGYNQTCDWASDYDFPHGLLEEGTYRTLVEGERGRTYLQLTDEAWEAISEQGTDPLHIKQAWVTVITYLMTHYNYLYE